MLRIELPLMSKENEQSTSLTGFAGTSPSPELLFATQKFVDGEPGTVADVRVDVPNIHYVLWGQRINSFARVTGFVSAPFSEFIVEGIAAVSNVVLPDPERALRNPADGDSFLTVSSDYDLGVVVQGGEVHAVKLIINRHNRLGGFQIGPLRAPSADDAVGLGEIVANNLQRAAALANVELNFPIVRAFRPDRKEVVDSVVMAYPFVQLPVWGDSPYPVVALLIATLAEGRRSSSVFYRALVFFKIVEAFIEKIQPALNKVFYGSQLVLEKFELRLPQEPFRQISPTVVGLSYTEYRARVQDRIRNVITHLDPSSPIVPFALSAEREVRTASVVLHYIAAEILTYVDRCLSTLAAKNPDAARGFQYEGVDKRRGRTKKSQ